MCSFKFPYPLKATASFSMRSPIDINSKYLCMASKRGLHHRQHVLKQILAKMLGRDFVN